MPGTAYNRATLKIHWPYSRLPFPFLLGIALLLAGGIPCLAQSSPSTVATMLVLPFENRSKSPGLEWIGESFPELLSQRLD